MCGSTARLTRWVPSTLTSYCWANCSGVKASAGPNIMWPALWTTTSMRPALADDLLDRGVGGRLGLHVEFDRRGGRRRREARLGHLGGILRVAAGDVAHRGVDGVAGLGEGFGGQAAEAAGGAGDEDDLLGHD